MYRNLAIPLCSTLIVALSVITLSSPANALKSYGESCHKRKDCDTASGFQCLKNVCQCARPESTVYSESVRACLTRIGRQCDKVKNGISGNDTDYYSGDLQDTSSSTTVQPTSIATTCIENAECKKLRARHWCQCKDGYTANPEGTECKAMSKYGEFCDENADQCDRATGTACINGNCQCPFADHQYFDQHSNNCVSFAGSNCSIPKMSPCVPNAECISAQVRMGYTTEKGVKRIHTKTVTQCLCRPGHSQTSSGFCWGAAMTVCNSKQPCNSEQHLVCVDGKCKCRNPIHEVVDENSGSCVSLSGSLCDYRKGLRCVENADCNDGRCECSEGYTVTPNKTCLLDYKEPCLPNNCNYYNGLVCIKGKCDCFDSYLLYDVDKKACVAVSSSSD